MEHGKQNLWLPALTAVLLTLFFSLLYVTDNKYKTPPPYGRNGVIALSEADFENRHPLFLIDGWLLTDDQTSDRPTYIGEFSNLRRGGTTAAPHGTASYRITLRYSGADWRPPSAFPSSIPPISSLWMADSLQRDPVQPNSPLPLHKEIIC